MVGHPSLEYAVRYEANQGLIRALPSPVFFHFPAIQYMACLSMTTEFDGPATIWAPIVISFGPANYMRCVQHGVLSESE